MEENKRGKEETEEKSGNERNCNVIFFFFRRRGLDFGPPTSPKKFVTTRVLALCPLARSLVPLPLDVRSTN